jgi:hypothetical protein
MPAFTWVCGVLLAWLLPGLALAQGLDPLAEAAAEEAGRVAPDARAREARQAVLADGAPPPARVVWLGESPPDSLAVRAARARLGRPDLVVVARADLYQEGRRALRSWGEVVPPQAQVGAVPSSTLARVAGEVARWRADRRADPQDVADAALALTEELWFVDRAEVRDALFEVHLLGAEAVRRLRSQEPPYFQVVGLEHVNWPAYQAAAMLWEAREGGEELLSRVPRGEVRSDLEAIVSAIDAGLHPLVPVAFHLGGRFDAEAFADEHVVVINGREHVVPRDGVVRVPRGRIDVFLRRDDGFGLSDRVEILRLDDRPWFVRETAAQHVGFELVGALRAYPGSCLPEVGAAARAALATYAALHPASELYLALPSPGGAAPGDLGLWRWVPEDASLLAHHEARAPSPVRWVLTASAGAGVSAGGVAPDGFTGSDPLGEAGASRPRLSDPAAAARLAMPEVLFGAAARLHWRRAFAELGLRFGVAAGGIGQGAWRERYGTSVGVVAVSPAGDRAVEALRASPVRVEVAVAGGVVLGRNAWRGLGPRVGVRVSGSSVPRVVSPSLLLGWSVDPRAQPTAARVRPVVDVELSGGAGIPWGDTVFVTSAGRRILLPRVGLTVGGGVAW